ncbi:flagellar M-ring protein FliF C-terminal domain-containing protein, partial [Plesiomonas shigelloides]|uniref:flagellar M-ring protein FliF C-terminal domain-containing protein n=1 Tax=Plesiomonas shigelloides TaxID=703 RepID=UPI002E35AC21
MVPGALSNQPADKSTNPNHPCNTTTSTPQANQQDSKHLVLRTTELNRPFPLARTQRHLRYQPGEPQHSRVSVLIYGKPEQHTKAELDQMTTMLQDASAMRTANCDQINFHAFPFVARHNPLSDVTPWRKDPNRMDVHRYVFDAAIALAVIFGELYR